MYSLCTFSCSAAHTNFRCDYLENCTLNICENDIGFEAEMLHDVLEFLKLHEMIKYHFYSEKKSLLSKVINTSYTVGFLVLYLQDNSYFQQQQCSVS